MYFRARARNRQFICIACLYARGHGKKTNRQRSGERKGTCHPWKAIRRNFSMTAKRYRRMPEASCKQALGRFAS